MNRSFIDVSNASLLDASYLNANGDEYAPSAEAIASATSVGVDLVRSIGKNKTEYQRNLKSSCGSRINLSKRGRREYQECKDKFDISLAQVEAEKSKQADASARSAEASAEESRNMQHKPLDLKPKKFLGMPMGVGITVTIIVTAVAGFFVYKKFIKK